MMRFGPQELLVPPSLLLPVNVPALAHLVLGFSSKRPSPATLPLLSEFNCRAGARSTFSKDVPGFK